jgi:hypothetical protein
MLAVEAVVLGKQDIPQVAVVQVAVVLVRLAVLEPQEPVILVVVVVVDLVIIHHQHLVQVLTAVQVLL